MCNDAVQNGQSSDLGKQKQEADTTARMPITRAQFRRSRLINEATITRHVELFPHLESSYDTFAQPLGIGRRNARWQARVGLESGSRTELQNSDAVNKLLFAMKLAGLISRCLLIALASGLLPLLVCGCSSFNREWKKAASLPFPTDSMEGPWEGRWSSDVNGHNGKLLCIVSQNKTGDYSAWFKATYQKVLKFSYTVSLTVESENDGWRFSGEEDLGKLAGGVYHYEGTASGTNFHSTYRSKYDQGVFEMNRPGNP